MELKQYVSALWKWKWLIAASVLVAGGFSYYTSRQQPRVYMTSTTVMVGRFIQSVNPSSQDFTTSQQLAQSYVQLVRREAVLQPTVDALGLPMGWETLAAQVNASVVPGTEFLQIRVVDTQPERAKLIADEVAQQLIKQSPTTPDKEQEDQRVFVYQQLVDIRKQIADTNGQVRDLEKQLAVETSARAIQDTQGQIAALQQKIATWQGNYAHLLDFYQGSRTNYLSVVDIAEVPTSPISPNTRYNVLLAVCIGFLLAAGGALLLEYIDDTVKTREDVDRVVQLPTLGAIGRIHGIRQPVDHLSVLKHPRSPITEAYRLLRTNIQFLNLASPVSRLLITSPHADEGKTTTACNLAIAMAQMGRRVVLVDGDLRRPTIHTLFGLRNRTGLTSLLLDPELPLEAALVTTATADLLVLPSGPLPPNPGELLASSGMHKRLAELQAVADLVIFDAPPVLAVADSSLLGSLCSGVILVVQAGRTRSGALRQARLLLDQVGLKTLGVVINQVRGGHADVYYYHDYVSDKPGLKASLLRWRSVFNRNGHRVAPAVVEVGDDTGRGERQGP